MTLKFSDGIQVDTSGPLRTLELPDGWYVVGEGKLIPVKDEEEAESWVNSKKSDPLTGLDFPYVPGDPFF